MQYHFHLIRNILKLPYCFPLETPSAPKSDNQPGGCQGPSVQGRLHAAGTKQDSQPLTRALVGFMRLLRALDKVPQPWPGLGRGPPGQQQRGRGPGALQSRLAGMRTCLGASWPLGWEGGEVRQLIVGPHSQPRQPHRDKRKGAYGVPAGTKGQKKAGLGIQLLRKG